MSHTNTALLLATKWYVVIKNIVLIDPDLNALDEFHRSGVLSLSYGPSLKSGRHAVTLSLVSYDGCKPEREGENESGYWNGGLPQART
jgi:hypothetical protein